MNAFKKTMKKFGRQVWELFKGSILATIMYCCASSILMMLTLREKVVWEGATIAWTIVCIVGGAAYQALASWASGSTQYEMLVSGNVSRSAVDAYGNPYKMSNHKLAKEYRVWKGFAMGAFVCIFPLLFGIIMGCNQEAVHSASPDKGLAIWTLLAFFLSGWTIIPFYCMNYVGISVSYFTSLAFLPIPIIVSGVFYIAGAYARRNKALRLQAIEDRAAAAQAEKAANKKINYGGLPGTKPKKRK